MLAVLTVIVLALLITGSLSGGPGTSASPPGSGGVPLTGPGSGSGTSTSSASTAARARRHRRPRPKPPFAIARTVLHVVRPAAGAPGNASGSAGAERVLPTIVRYPKGAGGPRPVIVFSQGYDYRAEGYAVLLNAWTRAGYVVADPTYPFTDPATPGGPNESDIVHHPEDLRSVISALVAAGTMRASPLHGLIDPGRIAIIGQSDGGDVSLAAAANSCCRDSRVRAAVILSGAELAAFGGRYYPGGTPPLLVVQGDADTINDPGCSAQLYDGAPAPKYYLDLLGEEHLPAYVSDGPADTAVRDAVLAFLARYLSGDPAGLAALRRAGNVAGVARLTSGPTVAAPSTACIGAP